MVPLRERKTGAGMSANEQSPIDPYARAEYRRLIAWEGRIAREGPWLDRLREDAPSARVLDVGCGTGEHVAFFSRAGADALGLDASESMIATARDHERAGEGRFLLGDVLDPPPELEGASFGLVICLGNMLPHILEDADLDRFVAQITHWLAPGGSFLLQILGYERILRHGIRALPVNVRPGDVGEEGEEEIVFLRLMRAAAGGRILFFPTTLTLSADSEEPVAVRTTRRVLLRAWTPADLVPRAEAAGLTVSLHGDMQGGPYDPDTSVDLVLHARRPASA